ISASIIFRPLTPIMSVITESNLMFASSSVFWPVGNLRERWLSPVGDARSLREHAPAHGLGAKVPLPLGAASAPFTAGPIAAALARTCVSRASVGQQSTLRPFAFW